MTQPELLALPDSCKVSPWSASALRGGILRIRNVTPIFTSICTSSFWTLRIKNLIDDRLATGDLNVIVSTLKMKFQSHWYSGTHICCVVITSCTLRLRLESHLANVLNEITWFHGLTSFSFSKQTLWNPANDLILHLIIRKCVSFIV